MIGFLDTTEEYEKADVDEFFGLFLESYDWIILASQGWKVASYS